MNIFYISDDPVQASQWMVDRHVLKMILESSQLLSTAHRLLDGVPVVTTVGRKKTSYVLSDAREGILYSATHINHPSAVWARQSVANYNWLVAHFNALMDEYTYRYGKQHKCSGEIATYLQSPPKNLTKQEWTPMPSCMADEYIISDDPIVNYRNYYKLGKTKLHSWKNREAPIWI